MKVEDVLTIQISKSSINFKYPFSHREAKTSQTDRKNINNLYSVRII